MDQETNSIVVAKFEKNSREEVWVSVDDFRGRKIINMRVHYRSETGQWLPGKQGIALSVDRYRDLAEAVLQLGEKLKAEGLLRSGKSV
jgi:hypothetical protein